MVPAAAISVDIVSDVVCPWCFIGQRRLARAAALVPDVALAVRWHPFFLNPDMPREGMDRQDYVAWKFGGRMRAAEIYARVAEAGGGDGIAFAFDRIARQPDTTDAHRLLHWAKDAAAQDRLATRLFEMFFLEGIDIGDRAVLAGAAPLAGLDAEATAARLATDEDLETVRAAAAAASNAGVNGVPCFFVGGMFRLDGAQPPDLLAEAIRQAAAAPARISG